LKIKMKIGLLLGSFNPITVAHVAMASAVINSKLCDKVLFVVAQKNPWKEEEPASFEVRCEMVESAIKPLGDKYKVCRFEGAFRPPVYSYLPIGLAVGVYQHDEVFVIAGTDTIQRIPMWKHFEDKIKGKVGFIEVFRGSVGNQHSNLIDIPIPFRVTEAEYHELGTVPIIELQRMDVSSTMVREMIKGGMNPYPYITEEVYEIIKENHLYEWKEI
jgi:nicotinate-nucleotide adenylyltransferase